MMILPKLAWERRGESFEYTVTENDWLTMVRAVAHEGQPYDGVVWCLLQRFIWIFPTYENLDSFVSAYAQPINPRWFPDGDLHKKFLVRNRRSRQLAPRADAEEKKALRRVEYARATIFEDKHIDALNAVLRGDSSTTVDGAVHYSASFARRGSNDRTAQVAAGQFAKQRNMGPVIPSGVGYRRGVNWFFGAGGSHRVNMKFTITVPTPEPVLLAESETTEDGCAS